jgi:RNase P subunit RPR2
VHYCALRVVCPNCHTAFVVGGSARNDLTRWRSSVVECRYCGAVTSAAEGRVVELHSASAQPESEAVLAEPCHA